MVRRIGSVAGGWRLVLGLVVLVGCDAAPDRGDSCAESPRASTSFLAVGDFGQPPSRFGFVGRREAVSNAIDREHACRPSDALLLLGDNFYPSGLTPANFDARIRDTVVEPFCRFLSLGGPFGERLRTSCRLDRDARHPVPLVAVMGNHDYEPPEDGALEKRALSEWIPEWRMPEGVAGVFELPGGVSVIAIDSVRLHEGASFEPVRLALSSARGPFRIVTAHHPLTVEGQSFEVRYTNGLLQSIRESGHVVHLLLAGHEHHLALARTDRPELPLQVVAGSGARVRSASHVLLGRTERFESLGFTRVVVLADDVLEIEMHAVSRWDRVLGRRSRVVAMRRIHLDGRVSDATTPAESVTR